MIRKQVYIRKDQDPAEARVQRAWRHGVYWDALIWVVAKEEGVPYVVSEAFGDGHAIDGMQFVNPFSEPFDIDALLA